MARRTLNRHDLREQAEAAEKIAAEAAPEEAEAEEEEEEEELDEDGEPIKKKKKKAKPKKPTVAKVRKPRAKKAPARVYARWGVFDNSMKQVAIFEYNQRLAADEKIADLRSKHKGSYFLQIVKGPMPEPEPVEVLSLPGEKG
jgi:hypothetical protein